VASPTIDAGNSTQPAAWPAAKGWLVGPWFDVIFIANVLWPLVVFLQFGDGFAGADGVKFWQLYFITTPHRWITLFIVFLDGDHLRERRGTFLILAAVAIAVCVGVRLSTGALTCLLAIDYVWNAWHFASQHHGVYSIYGRLGGGPLPGAMIEKWTMRGFLLYVILRIVSATWADGQWTEVLQTLDWLAALVAAGVVGWALLHRRRQSAGRLVYLASMMALYGSLLYVVHVRRVDLVLPLATASALFHAIEYLALVGWAIGERQRKLGDRMGALAHLVPRWGIALSVFVVVLGSGAWLMETRFIEVWLLLNVIVAFLHYAYDGLIWRRRAA
jgi:hypothetical protein